MFRAPTRDAEGVYLGVVSASVCKAAGKLVTASVCKAAKKLVAVVELHYAVMVLLGHEVEGADVRPEL